MQSGMTQTNGSPANPGRFKQRLAGDIKREASSSEVTGLKKENDPLKRLVADIMLKNAVLKKSVLGLESTWEDE